MSNKTLQKEAEKARKPSTSNHLNAKTSIVNRSARPRVPVVRKCCACQATDSYKTDQKIPQKSSGVATTNKASSLLQRKQCLSTNSSTISRKVSSAQVVQMDCRNELKATTPGSACTSPVVRQKATIVVKKQVKGEPKREQISQKTTCIRKPTKTPEDPKSKVTTPQKNLIKQFESATATGLSKQPSKKVNYSTPSKLNKSSSVLKQPHSKELKEIPSVKEVPKKKAEDTEASKGKSKASCDDVQSMSTESDCSYDSEDDDDLHITWDGVEEDYTVGENCRLCEKDLSVWPVEQDGHEPEFSTLPVSAVSPCGHVFHRDCLDLLEGNYHMPLCIFCESMLPDREP